MPSPLVQNIVGPLPWALRVDLDGYLRSVDFARDAIYREAAVSQDEVPPDTLLFFAGAWRLWNLVDGQHWIVQNSLALGADHGVARIRSGSAVYAQGSEDVRDIKRLRTDLSRFFARHEIRFLQDIDGVVPLLRKLGEVGVNGNRR